MLLLTVAVSLRLRASLRRAREIDGTQWEPDVKPHTWHQRRVCLLPPSPGAADGHGALVVVLRGGERMVSSERTIVLLHGRPCSRGGLIFNIAASGVRLVLVPSRAFADRARASEDCELARRSRIAAGVRRSDYAELLVRAAEALRPSELENGMALALSRPTGPRAASSPC